MEIQPNTPDAPGAKLTASFKKRAEKNDKELRAMWKAIGKDMIAFGKRMRETQKKGWHVAMGFKRIEDYARDICGAAAGTTFQAMRVVRELIEGDKPKVAPEDLSKMSKNNAENLAKMSERGVKLTKHIVEAAKTLPEKQFQESIVFKHVPALKVEAQARAGKVHQMPGGETITQPEAIAVLPFHKMLLPETISMLARAEEIFRVVGKPGDLPFDDSFLQALCAEFFSGHEAEYEQTIAAQEAAEQANAVAQSEQTPDITEPEDDEEEEETIGSEQSIEGDIDPETDEVVREPHYEPSDEAPKVATAEPDDGF